VLQVDAALYNAAGSAYVMQREVADAYARPFQDPNANMAVVETMNKLDWKGLLRKVREGASLTGRGCCNACGGGLRDACSLQPLGL
jgi:hypothetical protein